jgi:DedD protein
VVRVPADEHDGIRSEPSRAVGSSAQEEPGLPSTDGYILQVGSFRERQRAESVLDELSTKGFDAFMEEADLGNNYPMYRVRVGPYSERSHAQDAAEQILKESGYEALILSGVVAPN